MNIKELDSNYIANTYARFPLVLKEGKGSLVKDENGKETISYINKITKLVLQFKLF